MQPAKTEKFIQLKLDQLCLVHNANNINFYKKVINYIVEDDFDINYVFAHSDVSVLERTTALHLTYKLLKSFELFEILLNRNADFTIKDGEGRTVLHLITLEYLDETFSYRRSCELEFFNAVLSAHVKFNKSVNPKLENGISHFHAACVVNHTAAVELFLQNGTSVSEAVDVQSSYYAGYTGLHFAVKFSSYDVAELLLNYGANLHATCTKGLTPIHLLLHERIKLFNMLRGVIEKISCSQEQLIEDLRRNEKILKIILKNNSSLITGLSHFHIACTLSDSSIAESLFEYVTDVNHCVSNRSLVFQKFTALHFATLCNVNAVNFLLTKGANMQIENENRDTPLDLCIQRYDAKEIHSIFLRHPTWKNIVFSNGKTLLSDAILSMTSAEEFNNFLRKNIGDANMYIPTNSSLWPGYTLFHLAVIFSIEDSDKMDNETNEQAMISRILKYSVNFSTPDIHRQTPIHLAFRLKKRKTTELLLKHILEYGGNANYVDNNNLSYLHIACAMDDEKFVCKLLETSDVNVAYKGESLSSKFSVYSIHPGWTSLHISASLKRVSIARILINQGANINAVDMEGLNPIHWLLDYDRSSDYESYESISRILFFSSFLQDCTVSQFGLHYLHIASYTNNVEVVEKLLERNISPSMTICYNEQANGFPKHKKQKPSTFLNAYVGSTALNFALLGKNSTKVINLLLDYGGDTLFTSSEEKIISDLKNHCDGVQKNFMFMLRDHIKIQKRVEERLGLTQLHVACYTFELELIEKLLNEGADVNAQAKLNSPIFPGCTPLHLCWNGYRDLVCFDEEKLILMVELLLNHKADINLADLQGNTLILAVCNGKAFSLEDIEGQVIAKLFDYQRDFSVNSSNNKISHFHVACQTSNLEIVTKFLEKRQIDVNERTRYFCSNFEAGLIPLNLALDCQSDKPPSQLQVVDLLLKHGSDVSAIDVNGNTPLHRAVNITHRNNRRCEIIKILLAHGACINAENIEGITPFEKLLSNNISAREIQFFKKHGCRLNRFFYKFSKENYLGNFLASLDDNWKENLRLQELIKFLDVAVINNDNRTSIHNAVAVSGIRLRSDSLRLTENYHYLLTQLIKNCDIDKQDKLGKAAIHYAAQFGNPMGVAALLRVGADINLIDKSGKLAVSYSVEGCTSHKDDHEVLHCNLCRTTFAIFKQANKLSYLNLEVNKFHTEIENEHLKKPYTTKNAYAIDYRSIDREVRRIKSIKLGFGSLNLHDFLSETRVISIYPYLDRLNRESIKKVFDSIYQMKFSRIESILKVQFNKAVSRSQLVNEGANSLRKIMGFSFAGLCEEIIMYLTHGELKNLIASTVQNE